MRKKKIVWTLAFGILLVLALCSQAMLCSALGIRPAKNTVEFQPGLVKSYSFTVVNDDDEQIALDIYAEGELKDYVRLHTTHATLGKGELAISYSVEFPSDAVLPPGGGIVKIIVERTEPVSQAGNSLTTKLKLVYKLTNNAG